MYRGGSRIRPKKKSKNAFRPVPVQKFTFPALLKSRDTTLRMGFRFPKVILKGRADNLGESGEIACGASKRLLYMRSTVGHNWLYRERWAPGHQAWSWPNWPVSSAQPRTLERVGEQTPPLSTIGPTRMYTINAPRIFWCNRGEIYYAS